MVLVVLGAVRALALLRRTSGASWREAVGAFGLWLGLGWVVAQASARGLVAREGSFLRTPKVRGEVTGGDVLRGNPVEIGLALLCLAGAGLAFGRPGWPGLAVGSLLLGQGVGYAAAPLNSLAAARAYLTPELRRRRREMLPSWTKLAATPRRLVVVPALAATVAAAAFLVFAAPAGGPVPSDLPAQAIGPAPDRAPRAPGEQPTADRTARRSPAPAGPETVRPPVRQATAAAPSRSTAAPVPATPTAAATPVATPTPTPAPPQAATPTQAASPTRAASPTQATVPAKGPTTPVKPTQAASPGRRP